MGPSAINLAATNNPSLRNTVTTSLDAVNGQLALQPAVTNAPNDPGVDGIVTVEGPHLGVVVPGTVTAGSSFSVTVTALDINSNIISGYTGTVHFSSGDGQAVLPTTGLHFRSQ